MFIFRKHTCDPTYMSIYCQRIIEYIAENPQDNAQKIKDNLIITHVFIIVFISALCFTAINLIALTFTIIKSYILAKIQR